MMHLHQEMNTPSTNRAPASVKLGNFGDGMGWNGSSAGRGWIDVSETGWGWVGWK